MPVFLHGKNRTLTARVQGELDLVTADNFRQAIDKALDEMAALNLIIDLSKVTFIDSSGLGVILGRFRKINSKGGQMVLTGLHNNIKKILEISGILSFIPVCSTETEAYKLLEKKAI